MREIAMALGLNAFLLALLALGVWLYRRRQPMTAARLRRQLARQAPAPVDTAPFGGNFCRMYALQAALEDGLPAERVVCALLLGWAADDVILFCRMPKEYLKRFGDNEQDTFCYLGNVERVNGAEGSLFRLLDGWVGDSNILSESEVYEAARQYHTAVFDRLEQLAIQGRHGLRASGATALENKTRWFGFAGGQRTLYTPRGVRDAAALRGYGVWLDAQDTLPEHLWRDAVLLGCTRGVDPEQLALAQTLADALVHGAQAGRRVHMV